MSEFIERVGEEVRIKTFEKQRVFIEAEEDDVLYGGAAFGGKSVGLQFFSLKRRMSIPGSKGIIFRRNYPELERSQIELSRKIFPHFGAKYHESKHLWRFPNGSIQEFGYCFDAETEILTKRGWKLFKDLEEKEPVATVDDKNGICFSAPSKIISYRYSGPMINLDQRNGMNFSVTPEHRFKVESLNSSGSYRAWVGPFVERACDLKGTRRIRRAFSSEGNAETRIEFGNVKGGHKNITGCDILPFAKFLGWYISEGCLAKQKYDILLDQKNYLKEMIADVAKCKFPFRVIYSKSKGVVPRIQICSKELHSWIKKRCGGLAYEKRIPRECFDWPPEALSELLAGMILGDGHVDNRKGKNDSSIRTTSKLLADDIQELCLRIGKTAIIGNISAGVRFLSGKYRKCRKQYSISLTNREFSQFRFKDLKKKNYDGTVYCVTVEPHGTIIVRRNGRAMLSMNCESDKDVYNYLSAEYHDMCFDELTTFTEFQFKYLTSRCRSSLTGVKPLIRSATNPGGIGHSFVRDRYITPYYLHRKWTDPNSGKTFTFIPSFIEDNLPGLSADPTYKQRLKDLGEKKYMALALGRWDVFEGQFFDNWDAKTGILARERKPDTYSIKVISMDWGYSEPACILWHEVTPMGRVFTYRELYCTQRGPKELAHDILSMTPETEFSLNGPTIMWASPEIWGKKGDMEGGGETIQQSMQLVFGERIAMQKANNARIPGWNKMREYMNKAPDGYPWWQVSPNCRNLIRTIPAMVYDDKPDKKGEDMSGQCEDHAVECARYFLVSANTIERAPANPFNDPDYHKIFGEYREPQPITTPPRGRSGYG